MVMGKIPIVYEHTVCAVSAFSMSMLCLEFFEEYIYYMVLYTYKPLNDWGHTLQMRQKLRLDIRVFSYSVYSTEK